MSENELVTCSWVDSMLNHPGVRVIDIQGHVEHEEVNPGQIKAHYLGDRALYLAGHVPGALFVDWTQELLDWDETKTFTKVADATQIGVLLGNLGINADTTVITYDQTGGQFATRFWWVLKYYGFDRVYVMDGGFKKWLAEGRRIEVGNQPRKEDPPLQLQVIPEWRVERQDVQKSLANPEIQIIDARGVHQFNGKERRALRGGHIPGAISIPRDTLFKEEGGFKSPQELQGIFRNLDIRLDRKTIVYCNGGVASTTIIFALRLIGANQVSNYDSSWNEWGNCEDTPVEVG